MKPVKPIIILLLIFGGCLSESPKKVSLFLIGDSTMAEKKAVRYPETGWGEMLQQFFNDQVQVKNHALNGRSSKSFIDEGRWQLVLDSLKPGDYVFIQFGHNDQKYKDSTRFTNPTTIYRQNLIRYVQETRDKGANPVLLTSIVRRNYNEYGVLMDTHGWYPVVTREVARDLHVPMIDLQLMTEEMVLSLGEKSSKDLYLWLDPGVQENYPEGVQDNTHLNRKGANRVAEMVKDEIVRQNLPLEAYLNK
ncbi:MAG: rhamnogalacturonan acetylesterase [Anaerolineales bacterium]|jgi:lysophospholipase L1-like esterase